MGFKKNSRKSGDLVSLTVATIADDVKAKQVQHFFNLICHRLVFSFVRLQMWTFW
jgi:hypothetical protein